VHVDPARARLLTPLAEAPGESALVLDVDGTLAPIVARPELSAVPDETRAVLVRLAERYRLVACVSGRAGDDARRLVGVPGIRVVGNHGLELAPEAEALAHRIAAFRDEDKGLSLSYHYREAPDPMSAEAELRAVAARAEAAGLVPRWGRKVLEIRPPVEADKGTAVRALLAESGARRGLYAGDDATDLDAFAGLRAAGLDHAVCIAVASDEGPDSLTNAADLTVGSPIELADLLREL